MSAFRWPKNGIIEQDHDLTSCGVNAHLGDQDVDAVGPPPARDGRRGRVPGRILTSRPPHGHDHTPRLRLLERLNKLEVLEAAESVALVSCRS